MDDKLKQEFQKLLDYQRKDIELRRLNNEIGRDPALLDKNRHKKDFNDAKQTIAESEEQAGALLSSYEELKTYIEENESLLGALESSEAESEDDLAERVKKLESLKSKFQQADKKAHDIDDRSKRVCSARASALKKGKEAKQKYNEASEKHSKFVDSKSETLARLKSELDALRAKLDEKLFEEYKKLDAENKFPAVVPASGDEKKGMFNCGGCGLALPQQGNALLKDQGYCHCDNCRRIIVKM